MAARDARVRIDSGSVSVSTGSTAIRSTRGVEAAESGTFVQGYLFGMAVDGDEVASFDYDGETARTEGGFAGALGEMADRFADKCVSALGARSGESFKGAIVLSPEAVGELLVGTLVSSLCADAVRKGRSPLAGRLSETVAVPAFSLTDDGSLPGGVGSSAFDREGAPVGRHELVRAGELAGYLFNTYEANAAEGSTTGHASGGAGSLPAIGTHHLEIAAGDTPLATLMNPSDRAVLVNRFSGSTNPVTGDFSGVVKGGFLLSAGAKTPIKEVLIQGNIFDALKNVSAISAERRLLGGTRHFPTLRIEDVSITAG